MSKTLIALLSGSLLAVCFVAAPSFAADDDAPKYSIKEVMKKAFKGPLVKKVASGDASDEEKHELHDMLVALSKNEPKKGDAESWKKFTGALVKAAKGVVDGDEKAAGKLKKAANCKACHSVHR
jgi:hypothetical protein